jgi:ankyrin repeat protein
MDSPPSRDRRHFVATILVSWLLQLTPVLHAQTRVLKGGSYDEWFNAIKLDNTRRMEALLARGFDPNAIEPLLFDTGLILAIRQKSPKAITLLLSLEEVNIDAQSRNGDTALMVASYLSDTATALALIDKGAEINRSGWTALHYAAASGNAAIIRRLVEESAYVDAESPNGTTPLMMAARGGHRDALQLLLDEGADPTLRNERDMTAADFARSTGNDELLELLDSAAARRGLRDGWMPIPPADGPDAARPFPIPASAIEFPPDSRTMSPNKRGIFSN